VILIVGVSANRSAMNVRKHKALLEALRSRFRSAGCAVTDVSKSSFGFSHGDYPLRTLVFVDPHYIEFSTPMAVIPSSSRADSSIYKFLSDANLRAKFVKFTLQEDLRDSIKTGWPVLASAKLVSGLVRSVYDGEGLKNLVMLWFADIAEIVESTKGFELQMFLKTNHT